MQAVAQYSSTRLWSTVNGNPTYGGRKHKRAPRSLLWTCFAPTNLVPVAFLSRPAYEYIVPLRNLSRLDDVTMQLSSLLVVYRGLSERGRSLIWSFEGTNMCCTWTAGHEILHDFEKSCRKAWKREKRENCH